MAFSLAYIAVVRLAVTAQCSGEATAICVAVRGRVGKLWAPSAWRLPRGVDAKKINAMPGGCSVNAALLRIRKNAVAIGDSY